MKRIADMSIEELAGLVCDVLQRANITVTLTGGACVAIWSDGSYVSRDLDFIEEGLVSRRQVKAALGAVGFVERNRYFTHPETEFFVEFPTGPLTVGDQRVENVAIRQTGSGRVRLLSPTDCVKDRLAAFFHWGDRQALDQAVLVAHSQTINIEEIRRWSHAESAAQDFDVFEARLRNG